MYKSSYDIAKNNVVQSKIEGIQATSKYINSSYSGCNSIKDKDIVNVLKGGYGEN